MPHTNATSKSGVPIPSADRLSRLDDIIAAERKNDLEPYKDKGAPATTIAAYYAQEMEHHLEKARDRLTDGHGSGGEFKVINDLTNSIDDLIRNHRISQNANILATLEVDTIQNLGSGSERFLKRLPEGKTKDILSADFNKLAVSNREAVGKMMKTALTAEIAAIDEIMKKVTKDAISIDSVKEAVKAGSNGDKWCQTLDIYLQEITDDAREFMTDAKKATKDGIEAVEREAKARQTSTPRR